MDPERGIGWMTVVDACLARWSGVVFIVALSPFTLYPYLLSVRVLFSKLSPSNH